jgi:(p)ppGpp synthase/HD superfamily hydrolase
MNTKELSKIIKMCYENYDNDTMNHALRVVDYIWDNPISNKLDKTELYITAICHDLIEDTKITLDQIHEILGDNSLRVINALELLTKNKNISYIDYIKEIKNSNNLLAYCVKLADMKDHLSQTETLTDKLREKYWNAIPYLL